MIRVCNQHSWTFVFLCNSTWSQLLIVAGVSPEFGKGGGLYFTCLIIWTPLPPPPSPILLALSLNYIGVYSLFIDKMVILFMCMVLLRIEVSTLTVRQQCAKKWWLHFFCKYRGNNVFHFAVNVKQKIGFFYYLKMQNMVICSQNIAQKTRF